MKKKADTAVLLVQNALREKFPTAEVKRESDISIRVRIVDPRFRRLSLGERDDMVLPLLTSIPQKVMDDITIILLLTPSERKRSVMSDIFDDSTKILSMR